MAGFLVRRLAIALLQVLLVGTVVFSVIHVLPGDPAVLIIGGDQAPPPEAVAAVRAQLGLDKPLLVQYVQWLRGLLVGDLGRSLYDRAPVWSTLLGRLPRTLELIGAATLLAIVAGIPTGIVAALQRRNAGGGLLSAMAAAGISVPVYVTGTVLVLVFGLFLRWFPASGYVAFADDPVRWGQRLVLPAVTLSANMGAMIVRMTRSSVLEVLRHDYVRTAHAKGVHPRVVLSRHVLRNALVPVVTIVALEMGSLLGGTVLVEHIFNWPGLSSLLITAINRRDYPVVQGVMILVAALFVFIQLIVDIFYAVINPRIRYQT